MTSLCYRNQVLPISEVTTGFRVTRINTARNSTQYVQEESHHFSKSDVDDDQISKIDHYDCNQVSIDENGRLEENYSVEDCVVTGKNASTDAHVMDQDLM